MGKLRVVHISDLHLFVEPDGTKRSIGELHRIVAWAMRHPSFPLLGGFSVHEGKALTALRTAITDLCQNSGTPVLVVQSGDVSTFGVRMASGVPPSFPEWQFWEAERAQPRVTPPVGWIDLYGNHDVWPGTLPLLGAAHVEAARNELRRQHHPRQLPELVTIPVGTDQVEVYTLNTVQHTVVANTLAEGELGFDHPDLTAPMSYPSGATNPLDRLSELARHHRPSDPSAKVLRLLVMHHPPFFFGAGLGLSGAWARLTSGPLKNEAALLAWLQSQEAQGVPFQLVLAGHRHLVDPGAGKVPRPLGPSSTIQLVCGTPTQERGPNDPIHSFSVYDIDFAGSVTVMRTLYERPATAHDFRSAGGAVQMI